MSFNSTTPVRSCEWDIQLGLEQHAPPVSLVSLDAVDMEGGQIPRTLMLVTGAELLVRLGRDSDWSTSSQTHDLEKRLGVARELEIKKAAEVCAYEILKFA